MSEAQLELPGFEDDLNSQAALNRHLREKGEQLERVRELVALMGDRGQFIHSFQIRWPRTATKDVVLIAKMVCEEGVYVAFHSGVTWSHLIGSFGERIRAGSVNWIVDEYPPDNWVEILHTLNSLPRVRR